MLRARVLCIEDISDLEIRIDMAGASDEDRDYFNVHILAQGEYLHWLLEAAPVNHHHNSILDVLPKDSVAVTNFQIRNETTSCKSFGVGGNASISYKGHALFPKLHDFIIIVFICRT